AGHDVLREGRAVAPTRDEVLRGPVEGAAIEARGERGDASAVVVVLRVHEDRPPWFGVERRERSTDVVDADVDVARVVRDVDLLHVGHRAARATIARRIDEVRDIAPLKP